MAKEPKYQGSNPLDRLRAGEPFFFIRAQDKLSPTAVLGYSELLTREAEKAYQSGDLRLWESLTEQAAEVADASRRFLQWQEENQELVKYPD